MYESLKVSQSVGIDFINIRILIRQDYYNKVFIRHCDILKQNRRDYEALIKLVHKTNPALRKVKLNEKIKCDCGNIFNRYSLNRHLNSYHHFTFF